MKKQAVIELLSRIIGNEQTAIQVVDVLNDEGLLHLGYGDADIDRVIETFKETFNITHTSKEDRWAAARMLRGGQYEAKTLVSLIRLLGQYGGAEYAPVVNNLAEFEKKMVSIQSFLRKQMKGSETIDA